MSSADGIVQVSERDFEAEVLRSPCPVLVAFDAPWSKPCHIVRTVLGEVQERCAGRARVVRVNVDDNPDLGVWYAIEVIPTLLWFANGSVKRRIVGTVSAEAVVARLDFPGPEAPADGQTGS